MLIDNIILGSLVKAGSVQAVRLEPAEGQGWVMQIQLASGAYPLLTQRKGLRTFGLADTAIRMAFGVGVTRIEVGQRAGKSTVDQQQTYVE